MTKLRFLNFNTDFDLIDLLSKPLKPLLLRYKSLEVYVIGSGIDTGFESYCKKASAAMVLAMLISGIITYIITSKVVPIGVAIITSIIIPLAIVLPLSILVFIALPTTLYSNRGAVLEAKFPAFALMLSLILAAGASLSQAIETLYTRYLEDLKDFRVELELLRSMIRVGIPTDEALRKLAMITPSPTLKTLFLDLAATTRIGGDIAASVSNAMRDYIDRYSIRVEKVVNDIGIIMEGYLSLCMILPLLLGVISILFTIVHKPGITFESIIFLTVFVMVPIVSAATLVIVDSMVSKLKV